MSAHDRLIGNFEIRHPQSFVAEPKRITGDTGTAPRMGERERDRPGNIRRSGAVDQSARVPHAITVNIQLLPPRAHRDVHVIVRRAPTSRRMGRAHDDHLAVRLSGHVVRRVSEALRRVVVWRVAGRYDGPVGAADGRGTWKV